MSTVRFLFTCLLAQLVVLDCAIRCTSQQLTKSQQKIAANKNYDIHHLNQIQLQQQQFLNSVAQGLNLKSPSAHSSPGLNLTLSGPHPRPLDRPNVARNVSLSNSLDGPAEWPIMGGGEGDDLLTGEGKHMASVLEFSSGRNSSLKRSGLKSRKGGKGGSSNKTLPFDDEQSDSSDSNEMYDDAEDAAALSGLQKEPECAGHGRYYCTYKEDYPLKLVTEVTKYYKWPLEKLFRDLHAQIMPKLAQDSTGNLVCDSITRVVRPGWARNTNDRWLVVINTDNYHQYVTEVVCQYGSNSRCNFIPPCYYSSCQQRYNTQKLLVIDPANPYRGPFLSEFLFPSCCVCYVPSASDTFQDKYRSSPATIYQRTMQQESATNLHPPPYSQASASVLEEVAREASMIDSSQGLMRPSSSSAAASKQKVEIPNSNPGPLGPGEIRRGGEQYRRSDSSGGGAPCCQKPQRATGEAGMADFPRLGLADSVINHLQSSAGGGGGSSSGGHQH